MDDIQHFKYIIPIKYYKGENIYNGKSMEIERNLTFNATLSVGGALALTHHFSLISVFVRILAYDEIGNMRLI